MGKFDRAIKITYIGARALALLGALAGTVGLGMKLLSGEMPEFMTVAAITTAASAAVMLGTLIAKDLVPRGR